MILCRRQLFSTFLLLLLAVSAINARRIDQRRLRRRQHSVKQAPQESEDDFPSTSTGMDKPSRSTKLMLLKPSSASGAKHKRQHTKYAPNLRSLQSEHTSQRMQPSRSNKPMLLSLAGAGRALETGTNSGRTFKHLMMVNRFLGSGSGSSCHRCGGGGGGGGYGGSNGGSYLPYVILNSPTNVTNVNQNNLTNLVSTALTTPTTTITPTTPTIPTTTTTATGTAGGRRRRVRKRPNAVQAVPIPAQMPTQIYQQRENGQQPMNVPAMMFGMNGGMIPVLLPAGAQQMQLQAPNGGNRRRGGGGQRRRGNQNANQHNNHKNHNNDNQMRHDHNNPFEVLANSLKRIQYL